MDELLSPRSMPSFTAYADHPVIEFSSCEVPEQWLLGDVDVVAENEVYDSGEALWPVSPKLSEQLCPPPPPHQEKEQEQSVKAQAPRPAGIRRGRKPKPRSDGPTASHVEAERHRREKLNRRFCELRAAVPTVSRMDKASLLSDAAAYIGQLRGRIAQLEAESKRQASATRWEVSFGAAAAAVVVDEEAVEVRMVGPDAAVVRATSSATHAAARLMGALRALDLRVRHACVSRVDGVTVQDVFVNVPAEMQDGDDLRASLVQMLQGSSA